VILVDANLLIYAYSRSFPQHPAARNWLDGILNGGTRVGLPWESLLAFLRILSHPRAMERPESVSALWSQVQDWLAVDTVWIPTPTPAHTEILQRLLPHVTHAGLVHDAHLAALAITHGLTLMTTDGDFARFPNLLWQNPLQSPTQ
jgi:toxin-antitoxin system PIN domain toxin